MTDWDRFKPDWRRSLERTETLTFRVAAKLVFFGMVIGLAIASLTINPVFLGLLAGLLFASLARIVLPDERFQEWARTYYTGEAGDRWRRRFEAVISGAVAVGAALWGALTGAYARLKQVVSR